MAHQFARFSARVGGLYGHVRNGTLLLRLRSGWKEGIRNFQIKRWQRTMARSGYVDYRLSGKGMLRLYSDSKLSWLISFCDYEVKERLFLRRYLRSADVFIDIGANIGLFTIEAAVKVGKGGHVYAFEPSPRTCHRLQENIRLNRLGNVLTLQMAAADRPGMDKLTVSTDGYDAWSSLGKPIGGESFEVVEVPVVTLDQFVEKNGLGGRIAMIKIDVEGWETSVLKGGSGFLSAPDAPLLQVEFTREAAMNAGSSCEELFQLILSLGYQLFIYETMHNRLQLVPRNLDWEYENLFAVKDVEKANRRLALGMKR